MTLEALVCGMADPLEAAWRYGDMAIQAAKHGTAVDVKRFARISHACMVEALKREADSRVAAKVAA